jgi:chemosensory pili system protein ChpA (sensor histidine kinase/response regulator)
MDAASEFDLGPLTWVKGEIDLALGRAAEGLAAFDAGDASQLRFARNHLHQAHGALAIVGLDGVTQVSEALEGLLQAVDEGSVPPSAEARAALAGGLAAIRQFLDDLMAGAPNQALRLLPAYQALVAARGLPAAHAADLFHPDLSVRPPRRVESAAPLAPEAFKTLLKTERAHFQKGLLTWLKKPAEAAQAQALMHGAVTAIEAALETPADRALWWVAQAFLETLATPEIAADNRARQLCSHIDGQLRRLLEGTRAVPDRLLRDALYFIAQAPAEAGSLPAQVANAFGLAALIPVAAQPAAPPQEAALRRLRETLTAAEELWGKFCSGSSNALGNFAEQARQCATQTAELNQTDLKRLGQGFAAMANWLAEVPSRHSETVAMEGATAILLLQSAADNFQHLGTDFAQQVDLMVARLYGCIAGRPVTDSGIPALEEMTRKAQEKLLVGQVAREIQNNLAQIEQALDGFFRDPEQPHDLGRLDGPIKQIAGALTMLGHLPAVHALNDCKAQIQALAAPDYVPDNADFETLAQQLSLIGFFVEGLQHGENDFQRFLQRMQKTPTVADVAAEPASLPAELPATPATAATSDLAEAPVAETALPATPAPEIPDLAASTAEAALPDLLDEKPQPLAAPAPSAETLMLAEAPHAVIDAELLAIFLEEAHDVLATIGTQLATLQATPHNIEALTTIRRATHTLKGSGRMVGLRDLGEVAWELEQTYNLWLRQEQAVTPELLQLIADQHAVFSRWVDSLEAGSPQVPDTTALLALAAELRGAEMPMFAASTATSAAAPQLVPEVSSAVPPAPMPSDAAAPSESLPALADEHLQATAAALEDLLVPQDEVPPTAAAEAPASAEAIAPALAAAPPVKPAPTLYDIFREEALGHLETLRQGYQQIEADSSAPTTFAMTRAAHTLGGTAATVGLLPLNQLALALENALLRRDGSVQPASIEGLETLRQAIITLEEMFAGLARQEAPETQPQLLLALAEIYPAALTESTSPETAATEPPADNGDIPVLSEVDTLATALPALPRLNDDIDDQLLPIFLEEAEEQLRELSARLKGWRSAPEQPAQPRAIARLLHTFKGGARMAGAMNLGEYTHALETRVEAALQHATVDPAVIDEMESGADALANALERLRLGEISTPATAQAEEGTGADDVADQATPEARAQQATLRVRADLVDRLVNEAGELSIARTRIEGEMRSLKGSLLDLTENVIRLRRQLREIEIQAEGQMQARVAQTPEGQADFDPLELDRFTRFQELTRFMAESVNDVATVQQNLLKNLDDANAAVLAQARLNRSLQQALMGVRMLPFASVAERLYRIVRQTAKEVGKRANLDIVGGQVEMDRSVLDRMQAPIEHMLRNAVTHGIESRAWRAGAGKPETGEITIALGQEGNEIVLSLQDDGRGLDAERIRARAEALGQIAPNATVDDARLFDFIFQPGFSTADAVTQVSGRGVGMDVVKTEVAALGGRVEIVSRPRQGTTFRIYLPLTLAVTQTLLLRAGSGLYAVPSTMIEQVLDLKAPALAELQASGETVWQGQRYPFHYLPQLLGEPDAVPEVRRQHWVLLLRSGAQRIALLVDELKGNQEVVVKNIGAQLSRVAGVAGATVLGDGQVVLILNPVALIGRSPLAALPARVVASPVADTAPTAATIMVVDDSLTVRKITSRLLAREGYQVVLAKDGVDALEQLAEVMPDVVLSDIEMPRMDGFDLVRNIRNDARLKDLPVIMITSRTAEKHRNHAISLGANGYLGKPYDEATLLGLIAGYLAR